MALVVDASSPAAVRGSTATTTTAAFSPPASLVVAFCQGDANTGSPTEQLTVSSTGGLSWSLWVRSNGGSGATVEVWTARALSAPGSITVSVTDNQGAVAKSLFVRVFTDSTGGVPNVGTFIANGANTSAVYVSTVANSWGWSLGLGFGAGTPAGGAGQTAQDAVGGSGFDGGDDIWTASQNATTPTPGSSVTNSVSGLTGVNQIAAVEVVPTAASASPAAPPPWFSAGPGRRSPTGRLNPWLGTGSDIAVPSAVALSDVGGVSDALTTTAAIPLAEAGAAADAVAVTVSSALADSGTGADAVALSAAVALSEAAAGGDALTASVAVPLADAGSAADAVAAGVPIGVTDTGAAADALATTSATALADAGSATDALAVTVALAVTDAASAADVVRVLVPLALAEAGAALDALGVAAAVPLPDVGAGADAVVAQQQSGPSSITLADVGGARERIHVLCVRPGTGPTTRPAAGATARPNGGITYYQ